MQTAVHDNPKQNRLLAALSSETYARLASELELVSIKRGQVLYEAGSKCSYAYFPTTCIVSRFLITKNGSSADLAITGNEGMLGIALLLGGDTVAYRVDVQVQGNAYRMRAEALRDEVDQHGELHSHCLRYVQALMAQIAQSVVCNRHHTLDQQLCRWLLQSFDRVPDLQFEITQEQISNILGVRREGITEAVGNLKAAGLIRHTRGKVQVIDRFGLEMRACESYAAVKVEHARLGRLGPILAT